MTKACLVNQLKVKAGCGTQFHDCGQVKGENHRIFDLRESTCCTHGNRFNFVFFARTIGPVLQGNERNTGILTTSRKAEAVNGEHRLNVVLFFGQIVIRYLIEHFLRTFLRCTCWQLNHGHKYALVLIWQEGAWQTHEQIGHTDHDDQIQHQVTPRTAQNTAYAVGVVVRALLEHAVKPAEEAFFTFPVIAFGNRFQHGGTKSRSQDQRHQYRQRHC